MATVAEQAAPPKLGYRPSLDGLRAVSVAAVVLYHADVSWMPGGFLGVEVFFVVSGFLITALLVDERHHAGTISLRNFWVRRARRLLPALYLLLLVVSIASILVYRDAAGRMGGDVLAALLYVSNWWQIYLNESYFAQAGRPPLLQHLWSLAIEEQFYLVFPPLFALAMVRFGRRMTRYGLIGLAVASAVWMALRFEEFTDPSAVYYSTFTRASGLLMGAVLALSWAPWRTVVRPVAKQAGAVLNVTGVLGLVVIAWFFTRVNAFDAFIYRGGMFLLDIVCVVVIAVLVHPAARLDVVLGLRPLVWLGERSYAIYLWHWPIFMVTRPELDVPFTGWPVFVLRIALTLGAAEVSYRYVEQPLRQGALGSWWRGLKASSGERRAAYARQIMVVGGTSMVLIALIAFGLQQAASSPDREKIALEAAAMPDVESDTTAPATTTLPPTTTTSVVGAAMTTPPVPTTAAPAAPATVAQTPTDAVAVGDSVLLGAQTAVRTAMPGITVDAKVGRQFNRIMDLVQWYVSNGKVPGPLIIHAGTNGTFSDEDIDRVFEMAGNRRVLLVNAKVERPWQDLVNQRLAAAADRHSNAVLVDWHGVSESHPDWFAPDGAHLRPAGARAYADLIRRNL